VGPWSDRNFGQSVILTSRNAPDSVTGFNRQSYNWQGGVSVQHELRPGLAVNVGYFRTWYGNFLVTDNQSYVPGDYDPFFAIAPSTVTSSPIFSVSRRQPRRWPPAK